MKVRPTLRTFMDAQAGKRVDEYSHRCSTSASRPAPARKDNPRGRHNTLGNDPQFKCAWTGSRIGRATWSNWFTIRPVVTVTELARSGHRNLVQFEQLHHGWWPPQRCDVPVKGGVEADAANLIEDAKLPSDTREVVAWVASIRSNLDAVHSDSEAGGEIARAGSACLPGSASVVSKPRTGPSNLAKLALSRGPVGQQSRGMRREIFRMPRDRALALLRRVPIVHLASTTGDGAPVLRALDAAVLDDGVAFHGSPTGEKISCVGRAAVISAEEVIAHLPSYFTDPERACPATTLYRSVQVHGVLRAVEDPALKAVALEALMRRWQPEGGYRPIDPTTPMYRRAVAGVLVLQVTFDVVDGKEKLLQNRRPEEIQTIVARLRDRKAPGDDAAIDAIVQANPTAFGDLSP
jgi:nitroimidazol reductase NimA-like FMN-containing flavoprotein (pyridoxamine 5'-phosphate oxidase superfamily)